MVINLIRAEDQKILLQVKWELYKNRKKKKKKVGSIKAVTSGIKSVRFHFKSNGNFIQKKLNKVIEQLIKMLHFVRKMNIKSSLTISSSLALNKGHDL